MNYNRTEKIGGEIIGCEKNRIRKSRMGKK